jgi:hypothetical protein
MQETLPKIISSPYHDGKNSFIPLSRSCAMLSDLIILFVEELTLVMKVARVKLFIKPWHLANDPKP